MEHKESKEHQARAENKATKSSGETHSGSPNPEDHDKKHSTEHKSGYGGEGGEPRTGPETGNE